jgi:hypothetical protein
MSGYAPKLNLQDARMRPFPVLAELDVAHDGVKGRAPCVRRKAGVIETTGHFDSLSNHLHLGISERRHIVPEEVDAGVAGARLVGIQELLNAGDIIFGTGCQYSSSRSR